MIQSLPILALFSLLVITSVGLDQARANSSRPDRCENQSRGYEIGLGKGDITGAISGRGMLGYADPWQRSKGLHMRLWSRALYIKDPCSLEKIVMVIADLGLIFGSLKAEVLKRVDQELPGVFRSENIMLSATHTHSGPGGYSGHLLYNITTLGFDQAALDNTAAGIATSIVNAYRASFLGQLVFQKGDLPGIQFNRSMPAYLKNPEAERRLYAADVDSEMQLLSIRDREGRERGSWNWFPVHGVSLSSANQLLSGDNKGLAAYWLEKDKSRPGKDYVAGFVQSHAGDVSPYSMNDQTENFQRNEASARKQFSKAKELTESAGLDISGRVRSVGHLYDLRNRRLKPQAGGEARQTCEGTLGVSFAAGTENGSGFPIFHEGTVYGRDWPAWTFLPKEQKCQGEKVILLPTGLMKPYSWTANVAPFQIHLIGSLAIAALPFEMTTMAGRRMKKAVLLKLKDLGVENVLITALANDYLHYVTTAEEYSVQDYEGGSNLFGPWSLDSSIEIMEELSEELISGVRKAPLVSDERPDRPIAFPSLPSLDWSGFSGRYGDLVDSVADHYRAGARISLRFVGGELNFRSDHSLIEIQRFEDDHNSWTTVYGDSDPETTVSYERQWNLCSLVQVTWQSKKSEKGSRYRICLSASSQFLWQTRTPYSACSPGFSLTE